MSLVATKKDRLFTVVAGLVAVGVVALAFVALSSKSSGHTVYAKFSNAQFIVKGNTVHINGVTEGKVESLTVDGGTNTAIVKLSLTSGAWPIHTDASAMVRPVTVLGEEYVDLHPGSASAPAMQDGGTIPLAQTTSSTNLQSVLDAATDPTTTALGLVVTSLGQGMAGQGVNSRDAIKALSPALTNTSGLLNLLSGQNQLLTQMIDNVTPVLGSLDTNQGSTLDHLLTTTHNLLGATAASSNNIGTDLRELPTTLKAATSTFNQLGNLADQTTPGLASLTPLTNNLQNVSRELLNFSAAANPAAASLTPLLTQAKTLVDKASPVVSTLRAAGPQGLSDLANTQTIVRGNVADLDNFFKFIAEWASTTGDYDSTSHYFRFHAQADACAAPVSTPLCPAPAAATKGAPAAKTAAVPATPLPSATPAAPGLPGTVNNILATPGQLLNNLLGGLLGGGKAPSPAPAGNSATGLTPNQEHNLVGYLLGGL